MLKRLLNRLVSFLIRHKSIFVFLLVRFVSILLASCFVYGLATASNPANPILGPRLLILASVYVVLAVGLNLINGITGQFSIGHAGFYMAGAYSTMLLGQYYFASSTLPLPVWIVLMMIVGFIVAAIAGLLVGIPSLRLKGDYLAIVTLGFGEIIRITVGTQGWMGGTYGANVQPNILYSQPTLIMIPAFMLAIIAIAVSRNLLKTHHGLPFLAVRDDEVASKAMGINTTKVKVTAFVIGSAFAGAAGSLYALTDSFISPKAFTMNESFIILTMVVLGGTGSITGSTISAVLLFYLPELLRKAGNQQAPNFGGALIAMVIGVLVFKYFRDKSHKKLQITNWLAVAGAMVAGGILTSLLLGLFPNIKNTQYDASKMRMVIFSVTLILLMIVRQDNPGKAKEYSIDGLIEKFKGAKA